VTTEGLDIDQERVAEQYVSVDEKKAGCRMRGLVQIQCIVGGRDCRSLMYELGEGTFQFIRGYVHSKAG
jgi:hypothetical protein